jgi:hypothetical protein
MLNGSNLMVYLELGRIDSTIESDLHFAKILPNDTTTLLPQIYPARCIFGIASTEHFPAWIIKKKERQFEVASTSKRIYNLNHAPRAIFFKTARFCQ